MMRLKYAGFLILALAAVSIQMEPDDYIVSYYRDRGLTQWVRSLAGRTRSRIS